MSWPFLYFPHDRLSPAELSAARLDGHLVEIGEGYMPADAVESVPMRAASLAVLCGDRLAACLWSAAWVYGALDAPPVRHNLIRAVDHRIGNVIDRRSIFHDVGAHEHDLLLLGGVRVTRPARTLADLARRLDAPGEGARAESAVRALIATGLAAARDALSWIAGNPGFPGCRTAADFLRGLDQAAATGPLRRM